MKIETLCVGCMENDSGLPVCPTCGRPFDLPPRSLLQLKPRTVLHGQYLIGRALGDGGFGITYLSWDMGLECRLAIKEYMPNGVAGRNNGETKVVPYTEQTKQEFDWGLERFLEEARVLKKFSAHPGIVAVDTVFRDNGTAYLVMEFLDGVTMEEFLGRRGGRITFETAMRVAIPAMDALAAVHAEGILHRDISPDNIFLTRSGKVKLIDFGAARNALGQKSRNLSIILKEGYAPEEQYRASGIQGPWTDVYAMAATLYHAITGRIPQPALDRQAQDQLQWPSQVQIQIDPRVEAALMKALSIKASARFQSMEDFKAALTGSVTTYAPPVIPTMAQVPAAVPPPPPPPPPPHPMHSPPASYLQAAPSYVSPVRVRTDSQAPAASAKWLWWVLPFVGLLLAGVVGVTVLLPKFLHRNDVPPLPAIDRSAVPQNPVATTSPQTVTPVADPDAAPPTETAAAPGYDSLASQAAALAVSGDTDNASKVYVEAINLQPMNPKAYAAMAELNLYTIGNLQEALKYYHAAIARGGVATFHILHDRGSGFNGGDGRLLLSSSNVQFISGNGSDSFKTQRSDVKEAKKNKMTGLFSHNQAAVNAFHVKLDDGRNFNFAPASSFPEAERDIILSIIGRG